MTHRFILLGNTLHVCMYVCMYVCIEILDFRTFTYCLNTHFSDIFHALNKPYIFPFVNQKNIHGFSVDMISTPFVNYQHLSPNFL